MGSTKQAQAALARKRQKVAECKAAATLPKSRYLPDDIQLLGPDDDGKDPCGPGKRRATKESTMTWRMRKEGYVTCREIASRIGVHKATVYRWVGDGLIEAVDFNGAYYIKWESVLRHLGPTISEVLGLAPKRITVSAKSAEDARK